MAIKIKIGNQETEVWPPDDKIAKTRLENYKRARLLFKGQHQDVFERIQLWLEREQDKVITYVVCNFAGLISKVAADMLFGEAPYFVAGDEGSKEQEALNEIVNNNNLQTLSYEMSLGASWRGETIYKIRFGQFSDWRDDKKGYAIIEFADPSTFFPELDGDNVRGLKGGVFGWTKELDRKKYLRLERHRPGLIINELYLMDGDAIIEKVDLKTFPEYVGLEEQQETGYPGLLFEYVPNLRLDDEFWGLSDYVDMESVFDELNNRISRISRVLDKHESPKLILPPGLMQYDQEKEAWFVKKEDLEAIEIDPQELGGGAAANNLPRYLTWDAQLEAAFKQIDRILEVAMMMSETSPDVFGLNKGGLAESGRALKFRLIRTLAKINRKKLYFDQALRNVFYAAQYLEAVHAGGPDPETIDYRIDWRDGLPEDELEQAQVEQIRTGSKATSSVESSVRRLDRLKGKDLENELARIQEDELAGAPPAPEQPVGAVGAGAAGQGNLNLGFGDDGGAGDQGAGEQ